MHEFAVARSLVEVATEVARESNLSRITRLRCRIGDLRQVDRWLLDEAFALARVGTPCEEAELSVERTRLELDCESCGKSFCVEDWDWRCPDCGQSGSNGRGGDELDLIGLDGDVTDENRSLAECV